ncbi:uncharacterized protein LOC134697102 [Mytilus trossulus]|uniref:uncharacterized protein LOC134697102 n=1 Tax=Mytilus trossulus TaxID=6551 RepID=UPI003004B146
MANVSEEIVMNKTVELKKLLMIHDKAVQQMHQLDAYIDATKIRAVNFVLQGNKGEALHLLNRKSVAESLKHLYRQYRLKKWCQVQDLVSNILQTLRPGQVTPAPMQTDNDPGYEGEQMQNYIQAMMVSQCNFRRES